MLIYPLAQRRGYIKEGKAYIPPSSERGGRRFF
jgi:hypothetical protein